MRLHTPSSRSSDPERLTSCAGPGFGEFKVDTESIFERMSRARTSTSTNGSATTVRSAVVDHGNPGAWHGQKATTCVACASDADVLRGLLAALDAHHFLFGRFTALAHVRGWITPKAGAGDAPAQTNTNTNTNTKAETETETERGGAEALLGAMAALDGQLRALYGALPARTALVIFSGHADPRRMAELNARKAAFENALRAGKGGEEVEMEAKWTSADGRELEEEVEKAKRGLLFLGVKG